MATGDQNDILARLKALIPPSWFGDNSTFRDAILSACAQTLSWCYSLYLYAQLQTRIATATDGWLDMIAYDFFGDNYGRTAGQSDDVFRNAIKINLFRERGTRHSVQKILEDLTGNTPFIFEPQRPLDTGAYGMTEPVSFTASPNIYRVAWAGTEPLFTTSRSNLLLYSEQIIQSVWAKTRISVISNAGISPDGSFTANHLAADASNNTHAVNQNFTSINNITYTFSVFLKAAEQTICRIQVGNFGNQLNPQSVLVDLTAGTVVASVDQSRVGITYIGNGWYRVWTAITANSIAGTLQAQVFMASQSSPAYPATFAGDGLSGIYAWGSQVEIGSFPTPYISTTSAAISITDYSISNGLVTMSPPPATGIQLLWSGNGLGVTSGRSIAGNYSQFGLGDGVTTTFQITGGTTSGSGLAYGLSGGYGSQLIPYQAFVTAYRSTGTGIPYVAGYSSTPSGYSIASRGEYASQSMLTGSVTDAQIYAAVASVKMEGTIVWVSIQSQPDPTKRRIGIDYTVGQSQIY